MTSSLRLDFSPHPGAASRARQVRAQASIEARLMLRNGEQLLLAVVIPVVVLVGAVVGSNRLDVHLTHRAIDVFTPGVLALAVLSSSFTALAIATGFERRYGVLKLLGSSPLPRTGLLLGKVGALLLVQTVQLTVIGAVAFVLGWHPVSAGEAPGWRGVAFAIPVVLLGTAAFAAWGLLLAGLLRPEATLAAANLAYLVLLAGGGVVLPTAAYGQVGDYLRWLPSGALGEGLRDALLFGTLPATSLVVLLGWFLVGALVTARTFRWE